MDISPASNSCNILYLYNRPIYKNYNDYEQTHYKETLYNEIHNQILYKDIHNQTLYNGPTHKNYSEWIYSKTHYLDKPHHTSKLTHSSYNKIKDNCKSLIQNRGNSSTDICFYSFLSLFALFFISLGNILTPLNVVGHIYENEHLDNTVGETEM